MQTSCRESVCVCVFVTAVQSVNDKEGNDVMGNSGRSDQHYDEPTTRLYSNPTVLLSIVVA